jgi:hypothetical protein
MSIFSGISEVSESRESGVYLTEGDYTLEVHATKLVESKKANASFFVAEGRVLESFGENASRVGTFASWVCKLGGMYPESALRDIRGFIKAATGAAAEEINFEFVERCVEGDGDLLAGSKVGVRVVLKDTQKGGKFSKHYFRAVEEGGGAEA